MSGGDERSMADTLYGVELRERSEVRTGSLVVIAGEAADVGTHVLVGEEVVLGRIPGGLELRDSRASRRHARVFVQEAGTFAEDLGSTNGTSLNGRRLEHPTALVDGDRIQIGSTVVKYTLVDETEAAWLDRMARLAGTDPLTGLHAKHRFDNLLEQALQAADRSGHVVSVLMMDLDGVKAVNDTHG
ncbi:MAG: FHA domain-containing protein, partial [Myxococcales bacterium]|nr:FHA domain-containing protein [Myxococcales bacterium]